MKGSSRLLLLPGSLDNQATASACPAPCTRPALSLGILVKMVYSRSPENSPLHVEPPSLHCLLSSYLFAISGWPVVSAFSSGQSVELASGTFAGRPGCTFSGDGRGAPVLAERSQWVGGRDPGSRTTPPPHRTPPPTSQGHRSGCGFLGLGSGWTSDLFNRSSPPRCPPGPGATGKYAIRVVTRDSLLAGSRNLVQLWLVGEQGEADLGKKLWPVRSEVGAQPAGHWGSGGGGRAVGRSPERGWAVRGGHGGGTGQASGARCPAVLRGLSGSARREGGPSPRRQDPQARVRARVRARSRSRRRRSSRSVSPCTWGASCWRSCAKSCWTTPGSANGSLRGPGPRARPASPATAGCGATRSSACPRAPVRVWGAARGGGVAMTPERGQAEGRGRRGPGSREACARAPSPSPDLERRPPGLP